MRGQHGKGMAYLLGRPSDPLGADSVMDYDYGIKCRPSLEQWIGKEETCEVDLSTRRHRYDSLQHDLAVE
jgi:hypothetical protein